MEDMADKAAMVSKEDDVNKIKQEIKDNLKLADYQLEELRDLEKKKKDLVIKLGNIEVSRALLASEVESLNRKYRHFEDKISYEYGPNAVIDINTGEITLK